MKKLRLARYQFGRQALPEILGFPGSHYAPFESRLVAAFTTDVIIRL